MSTVAEIEAAIRKLTPAQVDELAAWLETMRARRAASPDAAPVEQWLRTASGAATTGVTTDQVIAMTRGER